MFVKKTMTYLLLIKNPESKIIFLHPIDFVFCSGRVEKKKNGRKSFNRLVSFTHSSKLKRSLIKKKERKEISGKRKLVFGVCITSKCQSDGR